MAIKIYLKPSFLLWLCMHVLTQAKPRERERERERERWSEGRKERERERTETDKDRFLHTRGPRSSVMGVIVPR